VAGEHFKATDRYDDSWMYSPARHRRNGWYADDRYICYQGCLIDRNNGWAYGNPAFFLTQLKAMAIAVGYSFAVSWIIFKFINFIYDQVSNEEEAEGLDASQHDENYVQGTLLVATRKA